MRAPKPIISVKPAALTEAIALILELIDDDREGLLRRLSKIGHAPNLQAYLRQREEEARKG